MLRGRATSVEPFTGPRATDRGAAINTWRWIDTIGRQLELCAVTPGETAVVLATDTNDAALRQVFSLGLERHGAEVIELIVRSGALLDGGDPVDIEAVALALTAADLVIDVHGSLVANSEAAGEVLEQTRVLEVGIDHLHELDHLVAHPGLAKRLARAEELLGGGTTMVVSSAAGTMLRAGLRDAPIRSSAGVVEAVGDLARWPSGIVWVRPDADTISGCVLAMPGDLIQEAQHLIRSPVRIEVEKGRITDVIGDSTDADICRTQLESLGDEHAYTVVELGWGMNLTRHATELGVFDPLRLAAGRGPLAAGRVNLRTAGSLDGGDAGVTLSLADATVAIDDVEVIAAGALQGVLAPDIYERAAGS